MQFNQASQEGIYLRYPENIPAQRELTYEAAIGMLLRGAVMAQNFPFSWAYIDKPTDGAIYLLFHPPNVPYAIDGIRFQEPDTKFPIPAGSRELEVCEAKYGFIPGPNSPDATASRTRRRFRLTKGGNPQLLLVHYSRGPQTHIQPALMNQPIRSVPPRPLNEPAMYVAGDKVGQKVFPQGPGGGNAMQGAPGGPMNFAQQQALLAQQNSSMDALEQRRRERERQGGAGGPGAGTGGPQREQQQQQQRAPAPRAPDEPESDDEVEQISTRTLALARYKRNHDWMNDVFSQAAFGKRALPPKSSPYSVFSKSDIEAKTASLQSEIDALQTRAAQRRADKIRAEQGGGGGGGGEPNSEQVAA